MDFEMTEKTAFDDPNNNNGNFMPNQNLPTTKATTVKKNKITDFFGISRLPPQKHHKLERVEPEFLYLPADITTQDVIKSGGSKTVKINDQALAVVAHNNILYAIESKCPHQGGPIHLGDIEELPGCGPLIKCPSHNFRFSLDSGRCIAPLDRCSALKTYPVRLEHGEKIKVGFTHISPNVFSSIPE